MTEGSDPEESSSPALFERALNRVHRAFERVDELSERRVTPPRSSSGIVWGLFGVSLCVLLSGCVFVVMDVLDQVHHAHTIPIFTVGAVGLVLAGLLRGAEDAKRVSAKRLLERPPDKPLARRLIATMAALVLVLEVATPLRYYLGDDVFDERFSWRMFSAVRLYRCQLDVREQRPNRERPPALSAQIHVAWSELMERNREEVTERYLRWRCDEGAERATVANACRTPNGSMAPVYRRSIECESGVIDTDSPKRYRRKKDER